MIFNHKNKEFLNELSEHHIKVVDLQKGNEARNCNPHGDNYFATEAFLDYREENFIYSHELNKEEFVDGPCFSFCVMKSSYESLIKYVND